MTDKRLSERDLRASEMEAMETTAEKNRWLGAFLTAIKSKAPTGYEDEDGFHFGAESPRLR